MGRSSHARRLPMIRFISRICRSYTRKPACDRARVLNIEIISRCEVTTERASISRRRSRERSRRNVRNGDIGRRSQHRLLPIKLTPRVEGYSNYCNEADTLILFNVSELHYFLDNLHKVHSYRVRTTFAYFFCRARYYNTNSNEKQRFNKLIEQTSKETAWFYILVFKYYDI